MTFLFAAAIGGNTSQAGVILGLYPNPPTTAGVPLSTRSGPGTWHLYAIEDAAATDFGISSYNISISGATAINHRSPNGFADDSNGDPQTWGFTLLRSATNVNPIVAAQALPGASPFLITGFGQTASNATTKITAIDPGASGITAASGASWGNYLTVPNSFLSNYETQTGHKWMFIAEGLGNIGPANITQAVFTVYSNAQGTSVSTPVTIAGACPLCGVIVYNQHFSNVDANSPGFLDYTATGLAVLPSGPVSLGPGSWTDFGFDAFVPPGGSGGTLPPSAQPATFDPATSKFHWNTVGAPLGTYQWHLTASVQGYTGTGFITAQITQVPEPRVLSLVGLTTVAGIALIRRRSEIF